MARRFFSPKILVLLTASVIALVLLELSLRFLHTPDRAGYPSDMHATDDEVGFRLKANFTGRMVTQGRSVEIKTNRLGYRDSPIGNGGKRVLSVGDSFCFGHGVSSSETYSSLLQERLAAKSPGLQVINMGVPGYNTRNVLAQLRSDGRKLRPDLVLLGLYVGNDITGNHEAQAGRLVVRSGLLVKLDAENRTWTSVRAFLAANSQLVSTVGNYLTRRRHVTDDRVKRCEALDWDQGFAMGVIRAQLDPVVSEAYSITRQTLAELASFCHTELGVPLAVVLLPGPQQYVDETFNTLLRACSWPREEYILDRPQQELLAFLNENSVPTLDLLPACREVSSSGGRLHLGVHFNAEGHRLVAESISRFITENSLIDP